MLTILIPSSHYLPNCSDQSQNSSCAQDVIYIYEIMVEYTSEKQICYSFSKCVSLCHGLTEIKRYSAFTTLQVVQQRCDQVQVIKLLFYLNFCCFSAPNYLTATVYPLRNTRAQLKYMSEFNSCKKFYRVVPTRTNGKHF